MLQQFLEVTRGNRAIFVSGAIINKQCSVEHDRAARKANATVKALDLIIRLGLHEPIWTAVEDLTGVLKGKQQRPEPIEFGKW